VLYTLPMQYTIPLRCATKQRPRVVTVKGKTHTYMPTDYMKWKAAVAAHLQAQHTGPPLTGPLSLTCTISLKQAQRGDIDNYIGAIMDSCNGVLFVDDRQISALHVHILPHAPADSISLTIRQHSNA
jgi:Holliday junction resolvase RusA-like endonuclease